MSGRLVLDASAILAYTQREHGVVELFGEVDQVLLPALALAETRAELAYKDELLLLFLLTEKLPNARILPLRADDALGVGRLSATIDGRLGLAHAVAEAHRHEAPLLTAHGKTVRRTVGDLHGVLDL
jgi:PIN domain nuclease of toxin-antitoxin system